MYVRSKAKQFEHVERFEFRESEVIGTHLVVTFEGHCSLTRTKFTFAPRVVISAAARLLFVSCDSQM